MLLLAWHRRRARIDDVDSSSGVPVGPVFSVEEFGVTEPPSEVWRHRGGWVSRAVWLTDEKYDRMDAPAVVSYAADGSLRYVGWFRHDQAHRLDGPAIATVRPDGGWTESFYVDGIAHRVDGPAKVFIDEYGVALSRTFFLAGTEVTAAELAAYRDAVSSGAPEEWALAFALGSPEASS